jgi:hypothetical protein
LVLFVNWAVDNPKNMKKTFLAAFAFAFSSLSAQTVTPTVLSNNGGYTQTAGGSIAWTIGEPVSETYAKPSNITTMGFHQTDMEIVAVLAERNLENGLLVFPNPVRDLLNVSFKGMAAGNYSVRMTDAIGKLIVENNAIVNGDATSLEIRMNEVAAGNYFLNVTGRDFNQTIKITKVQ